MTTANRKLDQIKECPKCGHRTRDDFCFMCEADLTAVLPVAVGKKNEERSPLGGGVSLLTTAQAQFSSNAECLMRAISRLWPMSRRQLIIGGVSISVLLLGGTIVHSLSRKSDAPVALGTKDTLALGDTYIGYSTLRTPDFQAALKPVGINLLYDDEFDQSERARRLSDGEADFIVTTLDQVIKHRPEGKIVAMWDHTQGADAVVLNTKKYPLLTNMDALAQEVEIAAKAGKQYSIVYAADTPSEYLALLLANKFPSFRLEEFRLIPVSDASEAYKRLQDPNENIAVAVLWEPYVSQASKNGYKVVISSADVPQTIVDVLVASDDLIERHPEKIRTFLETYYARVDGSRLDGTAFKNQFIQESGLSDLGALKLLKGIHFFDSIEAGEWLNGEKLASRINYTASVLAASGRLSQTPKNPRTLFNGEFMDLAIANSMKLEAQLKPIKPKPEIKPAVKVQQSQKPVVKIGKISKDIQFDDPGSVLLGEDAKGDLDKILKNASVFGGSTAIMVTGHTSSSGSPERNNILSRGRIKAVSTYLKQGGFKGEIVAKAAGSKSPLPGISPDDAKQQRVEVEVVRKGG